MEPTFNYIKNPENGHKESVNIETKNVTEQNKEAEIIVKKRTKKHGTSLGWGWFQGFNLFVTGCFLLICFVFAYFMMGSESRHEGPPKYAVDETNDLGTAIFNPVIPQEVRDSYVYKPPIRRPKTDDKPVMDEINLISEATSNPTQNVDLPTLSLISSSEEDDDHTDGNFYGDEPFGLSMQDLQLESSAQTQNTQPQSENNNPQTAYLIQQASAAWNKGQLSEPYQGSALSFYHRALENDPNNTSAHTGIDRIATHYLNQAKKEMRRGDYFSALDYTDLGLKADPLNPELNQLKSQLINE